MTAPRTLTEALDRARAGDAGAAPIVLLTALAAVAAEDLEGRARIDDEQAFELARGILDRHAHRDVSLEAARELVAELVGGAVIAAVEADRRTADPADPYPLLEEAPSLEDLPTAREWLDAGGPMREVTPIDRVLDRVEEVLEGDELEQARRESGPLPADRVPGPAQTREFGLNRTPYVGEGAHGCLRSAQIDREERDGLDRDDPRVVELTASAQAWERQAALLDPEGELERGDGAGA